ncbi:unnamed protein product [Psylliodes chrysocephalus]|uniref:Uncharacterized protein n=1 Tax=Psylliodes chrysocephalus TaxID=3402493 RepID=A0A9P0GM35_9CUCU|nr:unnamed protein product [Psylliodes chrysocephala]
MPSTSTSDEINIQYDNNVSSYNWIDVGNIEYVQEMDEEKDEKDSDKEEAESRENTQEKIEDKFTFNKLRQKKAKPLQSESKQIHEKVEMWATAKTDVLTIQKQFLKDEHYVKIALMKEKHEQELSLAREEWELKKHFMKEEHIMKMKCLQKQQQ